MITKLELGALWLAGTVAISAATSYFSIRHVEGELATRPPIAVIDYTNLIGQLGGKTSPDQAHAIILETRRRIDALVARGYLVVDANVAVGHPTSLVMPLPRLDDIGTSLGNGTAEPSP
jgi:hypothetical protein